MREIEGFQFKDELTLDDFIKLRESFPIADTEDEVMMAKMQKLTLELLCENPPPLGFGSLPLSTIMKISSAMAAEVKKKLDTSAT